MIQTFRILRPITWQEKRYERGAILRVSSAVESANLLARHSASVSARPFVGWTPEPTSAENAEPTADAKPPEVASTRRGRRPATSTEVME